MSELNNVCEICHFSDTNDLDYGEWKTADNCTIHHFCALLSTNSFQGGKDDEGIDGFLVKDIRDLIKLHKKTKCRYCPNMMASVRCARKGCARYFHVVCGIKNNCLFQFMDKYDSYCHEHVQIIEKYAIHKDFWHCGICGDKMGKYNPITSISSCCDQGYFHKKCIQKYAKTAGYLTKCPSCGEDPDGYRLFLSKRGIFCPDKDADWELTDNPYADLLFKYNHCDATKCICPEGNEFVRKKGKWKLLRCHYCGEKGVHRGCTASNTEIFKCPDCTTAGHSLSNDYDSRINIEDDQSHVKTNADCIHNDIRTDVDDELNEIPENTNNSCIYTVHASDSPIPRRKTAKKSKTDDMVGKLVDTSLASDGANSLCLENANERITRNPPSAGERKEWRNSRLDAFFATADFSAKLPLPPWLI